MKHYETLKHLQFDVTISALYVATPALGVAISAPGMEFLIITAIAVLVNSADV